MNLTKPERRLLRIALRLAIESHESSIDSYRVQWSKRDDANGMPYKIIDSEYRADARRQQRQIAAFRKMLGKLQE